MTITTRDGLKQRCLENLGENVVCHNLSDAQIENAIDDALAFFKEFHSEHSYQDYYKFQVTDTDITNEYITLPNDVIFINQMMSLYGSTVFPLFTSGTGYYTNYNTYGYTTNQENPITSYTLMRQWLDLLDFQLHGVPAIHYNRRGNVLRPDIRWGVEIKKDDWIVIDCLRYNNVALLYDDLYLRRYATELMNKQWGKNLIKYKDVSLLGGMTLNGEKILSDAEVAIEKLELFIRDTYELPLPFLMG